MNGKGDAYRPYNRKKWYEGWNQIFGSKPLSNGRRAMNNLILSVAEESVLNPPKGLDKWRFVRVEYRDSGLEYHLWIPPWMDSWELEKFLTGEYHAAISAKIN